MEPVTDLKVITDPRLGIEDPAVAQLVWYGLSRFTGEISGWRRWAHELCSTLAGIGHLEIRRKGDGSVAPSIDPPPFPAVPMRGWPSSENVMRRLGIKPSDLDTRWSQAVEFDEEFATLPLEILTQMFPPAIWQPIAQALEWGPYELNRRLERWLRLAARGEAPGGRHRTPESLAPPQTAVRHLMHQFKWLAEKGVASPFLAKWQSIADPIAIDPKWAGGQPRRSRNRVAPTLEAVRLARVDTESAIDRLERTKKGEAGLRATLRDQSLLDLCVITAGRIEPIQLMKVADFRWDYLCEDGKRRPAVQLNQLKAQRWVSRWKPIPDGTAARLERYLNYLGISDQPEHTIWPGQWLYFHVQTGAAMTAREAGTRPSAAVRRPTTRAQTPEQLSRHIARLLAPHAPGRVGAHLIRRFGQKMAKEAARRYLDAHPETDAYITRSVMAGCLLDHSFGSVAARYEELKREEFREKWARIVIAGIWDYYAGGLGAKKGLDRDLIVHARQRHGEAIADLHTCEATLSGIATEQIEFEEQCHPLQRQLAESVAGLDRDVDSLRARRRKAVATALRNSAATELEWRENEMRIRAIDEELDAARERSRRDERRSRADIDTERSRLARFHRDGAAERERLEKGVRRRERELEAACAARISMPDGVEVGDLEAELEELLGGVSLGVREDDSPVGDSGAPLVRDWLAPGEYAYAVGIPASTLNRHIKAARDSPSGFAFPVGDRRNAWFQPISEILEVRGNRRRRFVFSRIDLSKYNSAQIARMKELLSRPRTESQAPAADEEVVP